MSDSGLRFAESRGVRGGGTTLNLGSQKRGLWECSTYLSLGEATGQTGSVTDLESHPYGGSGGNGLQLVRGSICSAWGLLKALLFKSMCFRQ